MLRTPADASDDDGDTTPRLAESPHPDAAVRRSPRGHSGSGAAAAGASVLNGAGDGAAPAPVRKAGRRKSASGSAAAAAASRVDRVARQRLAARPARAEGDGGEAAPEPEHDAGSALHDDERRGAGGGDVLGDTDDGGGDVLGDTDDGGGNAGAQRAIRVRPASACTCCF
jgi:hypothetical protein